MDVIVYHLSNLLSLLCVKRVRFTLVDIRVGLHSGRCCDLAFKFQCVRGDSYKCVL